jgi:hypothetical protein
MEDKMPAKRKSRGQPVKPTVKRRTPNSDAGARVVPGAPSAPAQEQDVQRRLGTFTGKGEHARVGSRTAGIVGQSKRAFRTDNKRTKSKSSRGKPSKAK